MRALLIALVALVALVALHSQPRAEERIKSFTSDAQVNTDASVDVTETISVNAEGGQINRGILRDFPTAYKDKNGIRVVVGFDVISVKLDGHDENYAMEGLSNGKRVRIGSADRLVSYGLHSYEIKYHTTRQLGFFAGYDELYWNVTGNGWTFPIDQATAIVRLPAGAKIVQSHAYTGNVGESGRDFNVINSEGDVYKAVTTQPLYYGAGFTIAVAWQKGIVTPPSGAQKNLWFLGDNAGFLTLFATLIGVAFYYFFAWSKVGRDPQKGTIIPLFTPPPALGPAGSRFIWKESFDEKAFAAALVGLAVKGRLKIADDDGDFAVTRKEAVEPALTHSEAALFRATPYGTTTLENSNHVAISEMKSALKTQLAKEYEGTVFVRNIGWFAAGAVLSIVGLVISALLLPESDAFLGLFAAGWSGIWWGVILTVAWSSLSGIYNSRGILRKLGSVASLLFLIPFGIAGIAVPVFAVFSDSLNARHYSAGRCLNRPRHYEHRILLFAPRPDCFRSQGSGPA